MTENKSDSQVFKSFLFFSLAFIFGYCLTVIFHELGHALFNEIFGLSNYTVFYHPFGKSAVESHDIQSTLPAIQRILIYAMGPLFDIICSSIIAFPMWRSQKSKYLPFMMWNALSFLGQGIGIMMDAIDYDSPWGKQTDGGMIISLSNMSPTLLLSLGILSLIIGCLLLILLLPHVGVSGEDSIFKIMGVLIPGMVSYFALTTLYASLFDVSRLGERQGQLFSGLILTLILSILYKPLSGLLQKIYPINSQAVHNKNLGITMGLAMGIMLYMLVISQTSILLVSSTLFLTMVIAIVLVSKLGYD
jgi:hypothetical protein